MQLIMLFLSVKQYATLLHAANFSPLISEIPVNEFVIEEVLQAIIPRSWLL